MRRTHIRWLAGLCLTLVTAAALPSAGLSQAPAPLQPPQGTWRTFVNPTYGTAISYPADRFEPAADNPQGNDFIRFLGADRKSDFYLSSVAHDQPATLDEIYADTEQVTKTDPGVKVTYRTKERNWFVLSGYFGDKEFYRKTVLADNGRVVGIFQINYPKAERDRYLDIRNRMSKSFQPVLQTPAG